MQFVLISHKSKFTHQLARFGGEFEGARTRVVEAAALLDEFEQLHPLRLGPPLAKRQTLEDAPIRFGGLPQFMIRRPGNTGLQLLLTVTCGSAARLEAGYTFPEFGLRQANQTLVIEQQGVLPLEMNYTIERL